MSRENFIEEIKQRKYVKQALNEIIKRNNEKEQKLRKVVRKLIKEAKSTKIPYQNTGINVLEGALKKIVPVVREDYKDLTSSKQQRISFRKHIINAAKSSLLPIQKYREASDQVKNDQLDEQDPEDETVRPQEKEDDRFIDVPDGEDRGDSQDNEDKIQQIPGADRTGRNLAIKTFSRVESNIIDGYEILASEEDRELYFDYLITNLKLYFDRWEEELSGSIKDDPSEEVPEEVLEENYKSVRNGEGWRGWRAFTEQAKKAVQEGSYKKYESKKDLPSTLQELKRKYMSSESDEKKKYGQQIGEALAAMWKKNS